MFTKKILKNKNGQVMIMSVVIIGGIMFILVGVAGLLMYYQIREANDAVASSMSIYAADAGIEEALYCYYLTPSKINPDTCKTTIPETLPNNTSYVYELKCVKNDGTECVSFEDPDSKGFKVLSRGFSTRTERDLETFFLTKHPL